MEEKKPSFIERITFLRNPNKNILYEYFICTIIAFVSWTYLTINLGFYSYNIAKKYNFRLYGLTTQYTYLGKFRDFSDHQWRYFRSNFSLILLFAIIFVSISQFIKRKLNLFYSKIFYLLVGIIYAYYLHGNKIFFLFLTLISTFSLCKCLSFMNEKLFIFLTWFICIFIKIISEIYHGFSFKMFGIYSINENSLLSWEVCFGLNLLKIISYNIEYRNEYLKINKNNYILDLNQAKKHCKECEKNDFCLTCLKFVKCDLKNFNFINFLIYIFYPPLYFSGPIIIYNSFIFQWNNFKNSNHSNFLTKNKILYVIRNIITFFIFELFNHYIYVNCFFTNNYNKFVLKDSEKNFNYFYLALFSFNNLTFLWLKFTVIWRTARIWAWFDGILTEENMNRCVYNNYCFEGFWRAWHRSFNIWLIRYIYIPLGGAKTKIFNLWIIFSFVALWHDLKINLLIWGWFISFFFVPEILVKNYFKKDNMKFINNKFLFRVIKYIFCSFYIMLMVIANLIGFGMENEGAYFIIKKIFKISPSIFFIKILIFLIPSTVTMFYIRELEYVYFGKKLNY